jgi:hypothetical protein
MSNKNKPNKCQNCDTAINENSTFCSNLCYAIWQLETEGGLKPQPTKPEICEVNSLLGSVNSEFN